MQRPVVVKRMLLDLKGTCTNRILVILTSLRRTWMFGEVTLGASRVR